MEVSDVVIVDQNGKAISRIAGTRSPLRRQPNSTINRRLSRILKSVLKICWVGWSAMVA